MYSSPALMGDNVVVSSNDHNVYALNQRDGKVKWKSDLGDRILMSPYVEKENLYVGTAAGYLYQLRAGDGSIGWRFNAKAKLAFDICSDEEGLYFGSYNGEFHKLTRQGQVLWTYKTGFQMSSGCTFYEDLVLTTSWDQNVYALKRGTGTLVWKFSTGQFNYGNGVIVGDSFYYATHEAFYCFDAATGKLRFQKKTPYNTYLLFHNNSLYTQENGLTKRSLNGEIVRTLRFKPLDEFGPSLAGGSIVAADTGNQLLGISPDMEIQWKFRAKNLFWAPGVFRDGIYYVGNRDSHVYALELP